MSSTTPFRALNASNINPKLLKAEYAVRGAIAVRSEEHRVALAHANDLPFKSVVSANIGNPQQLDQKPITFFRQVLSLLEYPALLGPETDSIFPADVKARARALLKDVRSVGAYSQSQGVAAIRKSVAAFIESTTHSFPHTPPPQAASTLPIPAHYPHRNLQGETATPPTSATSSSLAAHPAA